jgi:uncharacterized FlaG/YvyC family protein|tara:strand:- start:14 stop:409 length:396 start_codon:yes stop_codon:yes gene_type:complete
MSTEFEIFEGKSLSSLFRDIYDNSKRNKEQLEILIKELGKFIKDGNSAVQLIPMIKEYLDINVKNDDQLVKLAGIVQKLIAAEQRAGSDDEFGLSDNEKEQLMRGLGETVKDLQEHSDKMASEIESVSKLD